MKEDGRIEVRCDGTGWINGQKDGWMNGEQISCMDKFDGMERQR